MACIADIGVGLVCSRGPGIVTHMRLSGVSFCGHLDVPLPLSSSATREFIGLYLQIRLGLVMCIYIHVIFLLSFPQSSHYAQYNFLDIDELAKTIAPLVTILQKHVSGGHPYYKDAIFFLSVALHNKGGF